MGKAFQMVVDSIPARCRDVLGRADVLIAEELFSNNPFVEAVVTRLNLGTFPTAHAALLLSSASIEGVISEIHYSIAVALELVYYATSIHRSLSTIQSTTIIGSAVQRDEALILLGDYWLTKAFQITARVNVRTVNEVLAAALEQTLVGAMRGLDTSDEGSRNGLLARDGALFAAAYQLGNFESAKWHCELPLKIFAAEIGVACHCIQDCELLMKGGNTQKVNRALKWLLHGLYSASAESPVQGSTISSHIEHVEIADVLKQVSRFISDAIAKIQPRPNSYSQELLVGIAISLNVLANQMRNQLLTIQSSPV